MKYGSDLAVSLWATQLRAGRAKIAIVDNRATIDLTFTNSN